MRLFLVLFCLTSANAYENALSGLIADLSNDTLDEWVDFALDYTNKMIIDQGYDPFAVDDVEKSVSVRGLLFTYEASFRLTSGRLRGLSTMKRAKDIIFSNDTANIHIYLPLGFDELTVEYKYDVKVLMMKYGGNIFGKIRDCLLEINLVVDMETLRVTDKQFDFKQLKDISVTFAGNMFDWITNNLVSVVTPILTPGINSVLQYLTSTVLNAITDGYNDGIVQMMEYKESHGDEEINGLINKFIDMLQSISR